MELKLPATPEIFDLHWQKSNDRSLKLLYTFDLLYKELCEEFKFEDL